MCLHALHAVLQVLLSLRMQTEHNYGGTALLRRGWHQLEVVKYNLALHASYSHPLFGCGF
jgi:hypothetical protein